MRKFYIELIDIEVDEDQWRFYLSENNKDMTIYVVNDIVCEDVIKTKVSAVKHKDKDNLVKFYWLKGGEDFKIWSRRYKVKKII